MMILSGRFIGFLPRHIADDWVKQKQMRELKPSTYQFLSTHFAAYRRSDEKRPLITSFVRLLRQQAAAMRKTGNAPV